jgi:hypothetical protein
MTMFKHFFGLSVLAFAACAVSGCAAPTIEGATTADDVITARCPSSLTVTLSAPRVFSAVPTKYFNGSPLSEAERARVKTAMDAARSAKAKTITAGKLVKTSGTCTYTEGADTRLVLRTKDGKDRLDIFDKNVRMYVFPESYSTKGVVLPAKGSGYFANVAASGQFSDGASLNVRIGAASVTAKSDGVVATPAVASLRVPVLDENGTTFDAKLGLPKTIDLDATTGPAKYSALREKNEGLMSFGSPNDYVTKDPATTLCFKGNEQKICNLLPAFTDNLLGDMFTIAQTSDLKDADDELDCKATTKDNVALTFFMSESDQAESANIPRCK